MVSFLFWNVGRRDLRARIARLAVLFEVDVLLLAECELPEDEIMYDQVMLRPEIMDNLANLKIVDHDGAESLLSKSGLRWKSQASDHLPIVLRLDL